MSSIDAVTFKYDKDGSGRVDPALVGTMLMEMGIKPSTAELLDALQRCKPDEDDKIRLSDFAKWVSKAYTRTDGSTYNRLLLKDPLGKGRRSGFDLPDSSHIYGKVFTKDAEGAGEVVNGWKMSKPSATKAERRDMVKMNKMATMSGCTNPSAVRTFHRDNEVLMKKHIAKRGNAAKLPAKIRKSTFGQPSAPNDCAIDELLNQEKLGSAGDYPVIDRKRKTIPAIRSTRAARGQDVRMVGVSGRKRNTGAKKPFKLKKFERVPARVNTNNTISPSSRSSREEKTSAREEKTIDIDEYTDALERELAEAEK